MSVFLRGNIWWCKFQGSDGKRYQLSTKTGNQREALAVEAEYKADVAEGFQPGTRDRLTGDLLTIRQAFAKAWAGEWRDHKSLENKQRNAGYVLEALGEKADESLSVVDMRLIADVRGKLMKRYAKQSTVNRKMAELSALISLARKRWGMYELPVLSGVQLPEGNNKRERILSLEEEAEVLRLAEEDRQDMADLIRCLIYTGCRVNEILDLQARDVDLEHGTLTISDHKTKGSSGRAKVVPMAAVVRDIMARRTGTGEAPFIHLGYNTAQKCWNRYRRAMGMMEDKGFVLHGLRHTCATRLLADGVSVYDVQQLLGHSTVATTERYAHAAGLHNKRTVAALDALASKSSGTN